MWLVIYLATKRPPRKLLNEAVRLAKKAAKEPPFLLTFFEDKTLATQNPSGESLAARVVSCGDLHHSQLIWVFRVSGQRREWFYFLGVDLENKVLLVGAPRDQRKIINLLISWNNDNQLDLF